MCKDGFENINLDVSFEGIVVPISPEWANTTERQGWLRVHGRKSENNYHGFNLVAKKVLVNHFTITTKIETNPSEEDQRAGLIVYFNVDNWYFLNVAWSAEKGCKQLQIRCANQSLITDHLSDHVEINKDQSVQLKISLEQDKILFYYSLIKHRWHKIGPSLNTVSDKKKLINIDNKVESNDSKEVYIGLGVYNLSGMDVYADFDHFKHVIHDDHL